MELYVYLICLGVGFVFTVGSALFGHFLGGGHDAHVDGGHVDGSGGHAEAGLESNDMPGVSAFSPTVIACFITAFGGLGVIFHEIPATNSAWLSAPLALAGAYLIAYCVLSLMRKLFRSTQSSSESKVAAVIGAVGHVITPIPENGVGEIAYVQRGARYSAPAREEKGAPVPNGQAVKITRIVGSQFYVAAV